MNAKELAELDLAVAKAEYRTNPRVHTFANRVACVYDDPLDEPGEFTTYQPTRDGAEAMRIKEREGFCTWRNESGVWCCSLRYGTISIGAGPTPAIAICKAVVALKGSVS